MSVFLPVISSVYDLFGPFGPARYITDCKKAGDGYKGLLGLLLYLLRGGRLKDPLSDDAWALSR